MKNEKRKKNSCPTFEKSNNIEFFFHKLLFHIINHLICALLISINENI